MVILRTTTNKIERIEIQWKYFGFRIELSISRVAQFPSKITMATPKNNGNPAKSKYLRSFGGCAFISIMSV